MEYFLRIQCRPIQLSVPNYNRDLLISHAVSWVSYCSSHTASRPIHTACLLLKKLWYVNAICQFAHALYSIMCWWPKRARILCQSSSVFTIVVHCAHLINPLLPSHFFRDVPAQGWGGAYEA